MWIYDYSLNKIAGWASDRHENLVMEEYNNYLNKTQIVLNLFHSKDW